MHNIDQNDIFYWDLADICFYRITYWFQKQ